MRSPRHPVLEKVPLSGPLSFAIREFQLPAFNHAWHQHPELELTWIIKGNGLRYVGDSVEPFHEGDFCLIGANLPHAWLSSETDGILGVHSLVVQFDPCRWGVEFLRLPEFTRIADLVTRASRGLHFTTTMGNRLRLKISARADPLVQFTALLEILHELAAQPGARPLTLAPWLRGKRMESNPRLRTVLTHLGEHFAEPVPQAEVAALIRLSPAAFSRFFRREVGKTFGAYLTDLRLSEACRQLLESDRTIGEIAFGAGFGSLSNFNRAFRQARGLSPGEFRRQSHLPRSGTSKGMTGD